MVGAITLTMWPETARAQQEADIGGAGIGLKPPRTGEFSLSASHSTDLLPRPAFSLAIGWWG